MYLDEYISDLSAIVMYVKIMLDESCSTSEARSVDHSAILSDYWLHSELDYFLLLTQDDPNRIRREDCNRIAILRRDIYFRYLLAKNN